MKDNPHIIIEFKQGEDVESLAKAAIEQIREREYGVDLNGKVLYIGVAHSGKACEVLIEEEWGNIIREYMGCGV